MTLSNAEIVKKLESMDQEAKAFKKRLLELCWYMRGGLAFSEVMQMGVNDLGLINDIVKDNLETTKKSGMPFF